MIYSLEHLSYEERLRAVTVQPGKERSWEEFIHVYLMEESIEDTGMVTQTGCAVPILEDTQNLI